MAGTKLYYIVTMGVARNLLGDKRGSLGKKAPAGSRSKVSRWWSKGKALRSRKHMLIIRLHYCSPIYVDIIRLGTRLMQFWYNACIEYGSTFNFYLLYAEMSLYDI